MAQTKTDYGLIYNTDGSVCTTVRPDQIPFPGVNSFAVETATTNLVTNSPQQPSFALQTDAQATRSIITSGNLAGWVKINVTKIGAWGIVGNFGRRVHEPDETKTYSIDCVSLPNGWQLEVTGDYDSGVLFKRSEYRYDRTWTNTIGSAKNQGIFIRTNLPSGTTGSWDVYVRNYQIEQKPFASSFVVGSRPEGRLEIRVEDLKFDIANDDWVISYWKYPVATDKDTQNGFNLCSLGQYTSDYSKGYINWGKVTSMNKYRLLVFLNDATVVFINSNNTFNPTHYFYHWHYEVLKKQGKTFSYYVDGVKQVEHTIPADKKLQTPFDVGLSLGGYTENNIFKPHNALIANVGNGKLQPGEFTDEHIMAIYEANRAFAQKGGVKIY